MVKTVLQPETIAHVNGPFCQAVKTSPGQVIFVSGQVALDADRNVVGKGDIQAQTRQVLENIKTLLEAGGGSMDDVVKVTIYLVDISHRAQVAEVRRQYWTDYYPASTMVEVKALASPDYLIEIEATAVLP